jgi:CubicO group peptidase (beta-lactamase class C family)
MGMVAGFTLSVAVLAASSIGTTPQPLSSRTLEAIDGYFKAQVKRAGFPGGSLAIVQGTQIVFMTTTGVSDLETGAPVVPDSVYCIGSLTKSFTATALLQLRDANLLDLDAPVTRYLPWFRVADEGAAEQITLRQLATHTSGLPTNSHAVVWQDPERIRNSIDQAVRALREVHLHHRPGQVFEYANMNYVVLGRVIEAVSGMSYDDYISQKILAPAGMTHSGMHVASVDASLLARPYAPQFGRLGEVPLQVGDFMAPASNLLSTVPDLARYAMAHLGSGATLLSPRSLDQAHLDAVNEGEGERYALGWRSRQLHGLTLIHHAGATGHSADVYLIPERQMAVVALFGAYGHISNDRIAEGVVALVLGDSPSFLSSPTELSVLLWTSRGMCGLAFLGPATVAMVPIAWRRRKRAVSKRFIVVRAIALTATAGLAWILALGVLPYKVPELPVPFGFHGWFYDLALGCATGVATSSAWALWGLFTVVRHTWWGWRDLPELLSPSVRSAATKPSGLGAMTSRT